MHFFIFDISSKFTLKAGWLCLCVLLLCHCKVSQRAVNGIEAYNLKQYAVAQEKLPIEIKKEKNPDQKAYLNYLAGKTEIALHNPKAAIPFLQDAFDISEREEILYALAKAYKSTERYRESLEAYKLLNRKFPKDEYKKRQQNVKSILDLKLNVPDERYEVDVEIAESNSNVFAPSIFDDKFLVYSSDKENGSNIFYTGTGNQFSDLYIYSPEGKSSIPFDKRINSDNHEGTVCFNSDYTEVYFTRCENIQLYNENCRIYVSKRDRGSWSNPTAIAFFGEDINVGHPALMGQDSILVFSVAPHGNYESYDLYYSRRLPIGWTEAQSFTAPINTSGNEKFPTVYNDTLYYSSDVSTGFGGLDIYKTYLSPEGNWVAPTRLPMPINSGYDDFGLVISDASKADPEIVQTGFFSSSRGDGLDKIFKLKEVQLETPANEIVEVPKDTLLKQEMEIFIAGIVRDKETKEKLSNVPLEVKMKETKDMKTDGNGRVIFDAIKNETYTIKANYNGYYVKELEVSTNDLPVEDINLETHTINFLIELEPIELNKEIVLKDIYYDYDKWDIRDDAKPSLDQLVNILSTNTNITIQLASHTDCRGEEGYNLELSTKRAASARAYIISKGINQERIKSIGYGKTKLLSNCNCDDCSEEEYQKDRRTTFTVLSY